MEFQFDKSTYFPSRLRIGLISTRFRPSVCSTAVGYFAPRLVRAWAQCASNTRRSRSFLTWRFPADSLRKYERVVIFCVLHAPCTAPTLTKFGPKWLSRHWSIPPRKWVPKRPVLGRSVNLTDFSSWNPMRACLAASQQKKASVLQLQERAPQQYDRT